MIDTTQLSLILSGGMLLSGLVIVSRMRLLSLVHTFRFQSILLALLAMVAALSPLDWKLITIAALVFIVKGVVIPEVLVRIRRSVHATERLQSFVRPTPATLLGIVAIGAAVFLAEPIAPQGGYFFTLVSLSLVLFGVVLLLTRTDMYGQCIGFLTMENGLFTFGLTIAHGLPLFVEIGILFDVLIVFVLIFALIRRAHVEHASTATEHLRELTG